MANFRYQLAPFFICLWEEDLSEDEKKLYTDLRKDSSDGEMDLDAAAASKPIECANPPTGNALSNSCHSNHFMSSFRSSPSSPFSCFNCRTGLCSIKNSFAMYLSEPRVVCPGLQETDEIVGLLQRIVKIFLEVWLNSLQSVHQRSLFPVVLV